MTFPQTPLNLTVEIFVDAVWTDITGYAIRDQIQIRRGRADEASQVETSVCTLTLNNRDGRFSPRNPTSPYYGKIGRNTPIRVSLPDLVSDDVRFTGEVSSWPQRWDKTGTDVYTQIECAGIMRRLAQSKAITLPAYKDYLISTNPRAYWPLDDGKKAQSGASASAFNDFDLEWNDRGNVQFGQGDLGENLPAGLNVVTLDPNGLLFGDTNIMSGISAYAFDFVYKAETLGPLAVVLKDNTNPNQTGYELEFRPDGTNDDIELTFTANGGAQTSLGSTGILAALTDGELHHVRFTLTENGGNVDWAILVDGVSQASGTHNLVAVQGLNVVWIIYLPDTGDSAVAIGHAAVWAVGGDGDDPPPIADVIDALTGYDGETAADRIDRLCTDAGIPFTLIGTASDTSPMGSQSPESGLLELIRECEAADVGILYEPRDSLGLVYRTRRSLFGQAAGAQLDYASGVFATVPEPVDDDQRTQNDVTVSRVDGGSSNAVLTSGPLSTNDPPDGVGLYRTAATLNVYADDLLPGLAHWLMHLGTIDASRYPTLGLDLARTVLTGDAALTQDVATLDVGDLTTITDLPDWLPPDDVFVLAQGFSEVLHNFGWTIDLNTVPADLYLSAEYQTAAGDAGADGNARFDAQGSTLNEALDTTETGVDVAVGDTQWTTVAAEFPFDVIIGGERMTVSAIGAVAAGVQTFTVTRSVNGIVKTHAIGAEVRLYHTPRWAF